MKNRNDIIVKPSDKGSGIVILSHEQYLEEANRQLNNPDHYAKLTQNMIPEVQKTVQMAITAHARTGAINKESADLLTQRDPRPAKFYMLPKLHKNLEKPPGRPIIAGNGNPTERIAEFVDNKIKHLIPTIDSYIKDTSHFVDICKNIKDLPPTAKLVTLDVSSLYTNIPHHEGLIALEDLMRANHFANRNIDMVTQLTAIILKNNVFEFNGQLYIQLTGTSMGSRIGPSFANCFMWWFEKKFLPNAPIKPKIWKRYIDDVFCVFDCSDEDLQTFLKWINQLHDTIKFTLFTSPDGVPFLDTFAMIENGAIVLRPYTKETDRKQYVIPSSCHPPHCIKSIPYSQALRIKRICTKDADFKKEMHNLKGYFKNRNYPDKLVKDAITRVSAIPTTHTNTKAAANGKQPAVIVIPFHPTNPLFQHRINEMWSHFQKELINIIAKPIVAFKRPKNLRDILTRARYGPTAIPPHKSTRRLTNRPTTTFDKAQIMAPILHIVFKCPKHQYLHHCFNNIHEAMHSKEFTFFKTIHEDCGNCNVIPVTATHRIDIKCNECRFALSFTTIKRVSRITREVLNVSLAIRQALLRPPPTHITCENNCSICQSQWDSLSITDHRGTNYRLLPFNCTDKNIIYIIHCKKCNVNYVGLTRNKLKSRISNHMHNIKSGKSTSVAQHFRDHPDSFQVGIIDKVQHEEDLIIRESIWISVLQTVSRGINRREEADTKIDYQCLAYGKHFLHSKTCIPHFISTCVNTSNLDLKKYQTRKYGPRFKHNRTPAVIVTAPHSPARRMPSRSQSLLTLGFTRSTS
jgi:hypothetical protein